MGFYSLFLGWLEGVGISGLEHSTVGGYGSLSTRIPLSSQH